MESVDFISLEEDSPDINPKMSIMLTNEQAMELMFQGFITISGRRLYRRKGLKTYADCLAAKRQGEMIAETHTAVFLLTPLQHYAETMQPALMTATDTIKRYQVELYPFNS